ncbi:hypothetical protein MPQ_2041 [Methylovorus sp. MP688]|nr:hypothetical protein MPQ_2041 [Methylovorus sp. MP688]
MNLNKGLKGIEVEKLETTLNRLGRGGNLPHWYSILKDEGRLPNYDGKTVGSVLEMIFVAVLENMINQKLGANMEFKINPARGVDLPDLDLGIKSPSKNFCTSEPYFTAYERLYGNQHDAIILLTDYQEAKKKTSLTLQVSEWKYLRGSEIADANLCRLAKKNREFILADGDEGKAKRLFGFLAYVNQSDWRGLQLLKAINVLQCEESIAKIIEASLLDFDEKNKVREENGKIPIPDSEKDAIARILHGRPLWHQVIIAADCWVTDFLVDAGRAPNAIEWDRLKTGPLDGKIGMSFALQWRYNFGQLFRSVQELQNENVEVPGQLDLS